MALTINLTLPTFGTAPGNIPAIGSTLAASQLVVTDASGKLATSGVTATEAGYLSGATSAIQTQLDAKLVKANNLSDLTSAATARTNIGSPFVLFFNPLPLNPVDATTYYYTNGLIPTGTDTSHDYNLGYAFTVIGANIFVTNNTTTGTGELSTLQIRNTTQATSSSIGTFATNATAPTIDILPTTFTGLSISVGAGDSFCIQVDAATWATNPAATRFVMQLICIRN